MTMGYILKLKDSCQRPLAVVGVSASDWADCVLLALGRLNSRHLGQRVSCVEIFCHGSFLLRLMADEVREPLRSKPSIMNPRPRVRASHRGAQLMLSL